MPSFVRVGVIVAIAFAGLGKAGANEETTTATGASAVGNAGVRSNLGRAVTESRAPTPSAVAPPGRDGDDSYGFLVAGFDLVSLGAAGLLAANTHNSYWSFSPWLLFSPALHVLYDDSAKGVLGSFLLHALLPVAGAFAGLALDPKSCEDYPCGSAAPAVGMLIGAVAATTIDALVLAHAPEKSGNRSMSLAPTLSVAANGAPSFGVLGVF